MSLADFESKGIVANSAFDKFKDQVTVTATAAKAKPAAEAKASGGVIDLNTATVEELNALPGSARPRRRPSSRGGPMRSLADFESKGIVSKSAFDKFKDQVTVAAAAAKAKPAAEAKARRR